MRIDTCWAVAQGLGMVDTIHAADFQARHLLMALRAGEKYRIARALSMEAGYYALAGGRNRLRTESLLRGAAEVSEACHHPHAIGLATLASGIAAFLDGRWKNAEQLLERGEAILLARCTGVVWELGTARLMGCVSLFFMGQLRELLSRVPALLRDAEQRVVAAGSIHPCRIATPSRRGCPRIGCAVCGGDVSSQKTGALR
jgi:eukaryotic-like serine/threonine-protein kinase